MVVRVVSVAKSDPVSPEQKLSEIQGVENHSLYRIATIPLN